MPDPSLDTWIPLGGDGGSVATRAIVFIMLMAIAGSAAVWFMHALRDGRLGAMTRRLLGRPLPQPWATGEWACGQCHTANRASSQACARCRSPRAAVELAFADVPAEPDILPVSIPAGAGSTVVLEHNSAAHTDGLNGHWRLRVNGVIVGSAARRDGALAMLRAVEGADAVLFDPSGAGYAAYALRSVIAAFESPKLPINAPCPEAGH